MPRRARRRGRPSRTARSGSRSRPRRKRTARSWRRWPVVCSARSTTGPPGSKEPDMIALQHQFRVQLPVEQAWELLTDLPKVATCLPGAQLDDVVDGTYHGKVSARIGPVNANYQGVAYFRERDDVAHRAVVEARGKEAKGAGIASAVITMQLTADGSATRVDVATDLSVSGRAAQFGRSLLAEVSNTLVDDFVRRLELMIAGGEQPQPSTPQAERSAAPAA